MQPPGLRRPPDPARPMKCSVEMLDREQRGADDKDLPLRLARRQSVEVRSLREKRRTKTIAKTIRKYVPMMMRSSVERTF
jgi:hypothetical protein